MNYYDLKTQAAYYARIAGAPDTVPAPDWCFYVNEALQWLAWETEYNSNTVSITTVANQAEYTLPTPIFKYIDFAVYDNSLFLLEVTENEMTRRDRLWIVADAGTPSYYWSPSPNVIRFYRKPDTGGMLVQVRGIQEAAPLVFDADVPPFPSVFHQAIVLDAAIRMAQQFSDVQETGGFGRLDKYAADRDKLRDNLRRWVSNDNAEVQRTVTPRAPERTGSGSYRGNRRVI